MVGKKRSEPSLPLYGAEEVGIYGIGFDDNRSTLGFRVIDQYVHIVLAKINLSGWDGKRGGGLARHLLLRFGLFLEIVYVFKNILLDLLEKIHHLRVVPVFFLV